MEHVADKLLGLKLKRDKRIRSALKHKIYVWEDFLLILIVISILWTGARISTPSLELLYPLVFIITKRLKETYTISKVIRCYFVKAIAQSAPLPRDSVLRRQGRTPGSPHMTTCLESIIRVQWQ